ncbi:MAG: hypothetical protein JW915_24215 [Chitinispirillaceae bacterium]|nr:hypothetical protein [Chitinispirillaceae bacterium]
MFEKAVNLILKYEGAYVNDPKDPGGETKFGISKKSYPTLDIKNLSIADAKSIYYRDYWLPCRCDEVDYKIALIIFDTAVNMGVVLAVELLQKSCSVKTDGIFGSQTMAKVAVMDPLFLITTYCSYRMMEYVKMKNFRYYGHGWTKRTIETAIMACK